MTRAARSSTRNLAEGFGRYYYKDRVKFCRTSRSSLYEVIDDILTCKEEFYISEERYGKARTKVEVAIHSINGYIKYLKSRGDKDNEVDTRCKASKF